MGFVPIWDLRCGDADDNRTSPYGTRWDSLIFFNVLEFSYLKAVLAFLALIIMPALLVGVAIHHFHLQPPYLGNNRIPWA